MDRIIKIVIYVAVLFFLSIWVSSIVKSCNNTNDLSISETIEEDALDEFEEDFFEENIGGDEATYDSDMGGGSSDDSASNDDFDTNYDEIDNTLESKEYKPSSSNTKPSRSNTSNSGSSYGRYMVLAGSYLIQDNAQNMINKLDRLGYDNSEIVVFNQSQYHSVCASRSSNYNEAIQVSKELKRRGIDNYVHTKH